MAATEKLVEVTGDDIIVKVIKMSRGITYRDLGQIDDVYSRQAIQMRSGFAQARISVHLTGECQWRVVGRYVDGNVTRQRANQGQVLFEYADIDIRGE